MYCYIGIVRKKRTPLSGTPSGEVPIPEAPSTSPENVADAVIEQARRALEAERTKKPVGCVVCGADSAPTSSEGLCWVCRRLKLSAWRDSDTQMSAPE